MNVTKDHETALALLLTAVHRVLEADAQCYLPDDDDAIGSNARFVLQTAQSAALALTQGTVK
jgi:hypothetical protein